MLMQNLCLNIIDKIKCNKYPLIINWLQKLLPFILNTTSTFFFS